MNDDINDKRLAAIAELAAALDELEHGDGLQRLTDGHGLQSRVFAFQWEEPSLQIDFRLPYERVLMDKETQASDNAYIGAAIRLAIVLLEIECSTQKDGQDKEKEAGRIVVSCDEYGTRYAIYGADGATEDEGDDWNVLIAHLESVYYDSGPFSNGQLNIIWP
jgi:hypothetical protein